MIYHKQNSPDVGRYTIPMDPMRKHPLSHLASHGFVDAVQLLGTLQEAPESQLHPGKNKANQPWWNGNHVDFQMIWWWFSDVTNGDLKGFGDLRVI